MKRITLLAFAVLCLLCLKAQGKRVQDVEGGFYAGPTIPLGGYHGGNNKAFVTMGLSLCYNLPTIPIDCGVFLQLDCVRHGFTHSGSWYEDGIKTGSYSYEGNQNNRTLTIGVVGNYNFRRSSKVNPFVGLGLGIGFNDAVGDVTFPSKGTSLVVMPRIGVEFWQLFRLTAFATVCRTGYNCAGLTLGFSFGGRPK